MIYPESYYKAQRDYRLHRAKRHCDLIDKMGVEKWKKIHGDDVKKHKGIDGWNELMADMRIIREG